MILNFQSPPDEASRGWLQQRLAEPLPAPLAQMVIWARGVLERLRDRLAPPQIATLELTFAPATLHAMAAGVRVGLFDALGARPQRAEALAKRTGLHPGALQRTLRLLALRGIVRVDREGRFSHGRISRTLRRGDALGMRDWVLYAASPANQAAWAHLEHVLHTGQSAFEHLHGMSVWRWFDQHAEEGEIFARAMMGLSAITAPVIAASYPFTEVETVCDVGGGAGLLLSELVIRHPHLRGVLCDRREVLASAQGLLERRGVASKVELIDGCFFEALPEGCDLYLLKNVLHDWDDGSCLRILANVRRAISPLGRLLVAECIPRPSSPDPASTPSDVQMMVTCKDARERTRTELVELLRRAKFDPRRSFDHPAVSWIEAVPAQP